MFNKKIIVSLLTLGMLTAMVGAGTFAYFSDTRLAGNDSITSGTIILNGVNTTADYIIPNAIPGDTNVLIENATASNAGTIPADLYVNVTAPTADTSGGADLLSHMHIYLNGQPANGTAVNLGNLQPGNANSIPVTITYSYDNLITPQNSEQGQTIHYSVKYSLVQSVNMPANATVNP